MDQFAAPRESYEATKTRLPLNQLAYVLHLEKQDVAWLRDRVRERSHGMRFEVRVIGYETDCPVTFTPPYVGKFWNPVELLWSSAKRAYRRLPKETRRNETMAVEAMKNILGGFQHREQCLANMCLPGFRFSFAVLSAFYQQSVVVYKGRRTLFPSLQQAIFDYAAETKRSVECSVAGDEEHLFAVDFELPGTTIRRAPEGLARLNFPVSVLHRDRSLRRFESVQVDMQSMVEIPDWMAALPAASEPEDSPLDDIYACGDKGDSETITSTHVDPGAAAGTIDEKPVVGRARRVRDERNSLHLWQQAYTY